MKKLMRGIVFIACFFALVGWGSTYEHKDEDVKNDKNPHADDKGQKAVEEIKPSESEKGVQHADEKRQKDLEEIRRSQGTGGSRKNLHTYGSVDV